MNSPTLHTERLLIRAFKECDLETFANYRASPEVAKYQSWSDYTLEHAKALFAKMDYSQFAMIGNWYQLAIADKQTDTILGDIALHFIDNEQMEVGFTIAPQNQRKGIAKEALMAIQAYLFNDLHKHRIVATTDAENSASYALLEATGFRREAHFRQNIFFKGAWGDEYQYALLRSEFRLPPSPENQ